MKQVSISPAEASEHGIQSQFGALCFRIAQDKPQILLITSRTTRRWIIPKGWPIKGLSPAETAALEAQEEAGVEGRIRDHCLGLFAYDKILDDGSGVPVAVAVFPLKVRTLMRSYPEASERRRKWFTPKKAASKVDEPELAAILRAFDPRHLRP